MTKPDKKKVGRVDLNDIHEIIRNRICLLDYPPGTVLREAELAAEFGLSRTPVREVLQRLAFAGLVEVRDGVGTIVTSFDYLHVKDIYEMRLKAAELIGVLSPRDCRDHHIHAAERLLARARILRKAFDLREYGLINHELHFLVGALIGNEALRHIWDRFYFQIARLWYGLARQMPDEVTSSLIRQIEEITRAMRENDVAAIGYIERNYIAFGMRRVMAHFEQDGVDTLTLSDHKVLG